MTYFTVINKIFLDILKHGIKMYKNILIYENFRYTIQDVNRYNFLWSHK